MNSTRAAANKALSNYRSNLNLKLNQLISKRDSLTERLTETASREQEIIPLVREHKVKEELYLMLLSKEQENALAMAVTESSAGFWKPPMGPTFPFPQKPFNTSREERREVPCSAYLPSWERPC